MRIPAKYNILLSNSTTAVDKFPFPSPVAFAVQTGTRTTSANVIATLITFDLSLATGTASSIRSLSNRRLRSFHAVIVLDTGWRLELCQNEEEDSYMFFLLMRKEK